MLDTQRCQHSWWPMEVLWCCVVLHQQLSFSGAQEMLQVLQEHYERCKAKTLKVRQCPNEIATETSIQNYVGYKMLFNYISPPAHFSVDGNNSRSLYSPVGFLGQQRLRNLWLAVCGFILRRGAQSQYHQVQNIGLSAQSPGPERPLTNTCKDCELLYSPSAPGQVCANEIWGQTVLVETGSRLELSFPASSRRV